MNIAPCVVCMLLLALPSADAATASPERTTPRVMLGVGSLDGSFAPSAPGAVFKGVPFAQPPVGRLRWHEPLPVSPWESVKVASSFGSACFQYAGGVPSGDEDCLYLNIWTPEWPVRSLRPVMLWLFGGANATGSAANPTFDGSAFARQGMVVVTANYRLGVMGFMAHPGLSRESEHGSSGNYALLDQIMALRWIRENIAAFGGDPLHVTLFGQSSGSYDLLLLMTSPLARGLFVNAIAQSGQLLSYNGSMPKSRAEEIGTRIATDLKAPEATGGIAYLRALPAEQVAGVAAKWLPTDLSSDTGLLTNIDGWVLPELPARVFAAGRQATIPLIVGNNAREITPQISPDELRRQIEAKYGDLAPQALEAYGLANNGPGRDDPLLGGPGSQWMTDIVQRCAAGMQADWHAAAGNPTWQYEFERTIPGREGAGSFHGAEVAFVFGTLGVAASNSSAFTASDREASSQMQEYWTRFAKIGDPNGGLLPVWPRAGTRSYLAFAADGPAVKERPQSGPCRVFREWTLRWLAKQP